MGAKQTNPVGDESCESRVGRDQSRKHRQHTLLHARHRKRQSRQHLGQSHLLDDALEDRHVVLGQPTERLNSSNTKLTEGKVRWEDVTHRQSRNANSVDRRVAEDVPQQQTDFDDGQFLSKSAKRSNQCFVDFECTVHVACTVCTL